MALFFGSCMLPGWKYFSQWVGSLFLLVHEISPQRLAYNIYIYISWWKRNIHLWTSTPDVLCESKSQLLGKKIIPTITGCDWISQITSHTDVHRWKSCHDGICCFLYVLNLPTWVIVHWQNTWVAPQGFAFNSHSQLYLCGRPPVPEESSWWVNITGKPSIEKSYMYSMVLSWFIKPASLSSILSW